MQLSGCKINAVKFLAVFPDLFRLANVVISARMLKALVCNVLGECKYFLSASVLF